MTYRVTAGLFCICLGFAHLAVGQDPPQTSVSSPGTGQDSTLPEPPRYSTAPDEADVEQLTRGPIHEAFAGQINPNPEPGLEVKQKPPEPIKEIPPEFRPEGDNVDWIPGYWFWDTDRSDFIWVSGVWRVAPPDRRWIPGYWQETAAGHQWVSGFWSAASAELEYLTPPPANLDSGPAETAPSPSHFWVPGSWLPQSSGYAWRPGYWRPSHGDWMWIPSYYSWTPRGCIFVDGYWDYRIHQRGLIGAPVFFHRPLYRTAGYYYRPRVALAVENLLLHLFVHPGHRHYYFGDYYDRHYLGQHYYSLSHHYRRSYYDPIVSYYHSRHAIRGISFTGRLDGWHDHYRAHPEHRPARTWTGSVQAHSDELTRGGGRGDHRHSAQAVLGRPFDGLAGNEGPSNRVRRISETERQRFASGVPNALTAVRTGRQRNEQLASNRATPEDRGFRRGSWAPPSEPRSGTGRTRVATPPSLESPRGNRDRSGLPDPRGSTRNGRSPRGLAEIDPRASSNGLTRGQGDSQRIDRSTTPRRATDFDPRGGRTRDQRSSTPLLDDREGRNRGAFPDSRTGRDSPDELLRRLEAARNGRSGGPSGADEMMRRMEAARRAGDFRGGQVRPPGTPNTGAGARRGNSGLGGATGRPAAGRGPGQPGSGRPEVGRGAGQLRSGQPGNGRPAAGRGGAPSAGRPTIGRGGGSPNTGRPAVGRGGGSPSAGRPAGGRGGGNRERGGGNGGGRGRRGG